MLEPRSAYKLALAVTVSSAHGRKGEHGVSAYDQGAMLARREHTLTRCIEATLRAQSAFLIA